MKKGESRIGAHRYFSMLKYVQFTYETCTYAIPVHDIIYLSMLKTNFLSLTEFFREL